MFRPTKIALDIKSGIWHEVEYCYPDPNSPGLDYVVRTRDGRLHSVGFSFLEPIPNDYQI